MRMRWVAIAAVSAVGLCLPGEGSAAVRRGWLERLSGPGPFDGWVFEPPPIFCFDANEVQWFFEPTDMKSDPIRPWCIDFALGWYETDDDAEQPADEALRFGEVDAMTLDVGVMYRFHPAFSAGGSMGFIGFSGDKFEDFRTLTLMPVHVSFRPFALGESVTARPTWRRFFSIDFKQYIIPAHLTGSDFGVPANPLDEEWEAVSYWSIGVDIGVFIFK
jgi:hypothetical protein